MVGRDREALVREGGVRLRGQVPKAQTGDVKAAADPAAAPGHHECGRLGTRSAFRVSTCRLLLRYCRPWKGSDRELQETSARRVRPRGGDLDAGNNRTGRHEAKGGRISQLFRGPI